MPDADSSTSYRFAGFELRPRERMLLAGGLQVAIGARAFDLLVILVQRSGRLVTKDDLLDSVWPQLAVEENNLQVQVSALRKIVGQDAIATVSGRGYRFTPAVQVLEHDAPGPLRTWPPGLPRQATSFIGRTKELREGLRLLAQAPLVTLVGVAGIGKTRLALELAAARGGFTDSAVFLDLAPVADAASAVEAATLAMAVTPLPGQPLRDALMQHAASRRQLVVIDHCEHLGAACAGLVADLAQSSAGSKFIATSQHPLRTADEAVFPVHGLDVPAPSAATPHDVGGCSAVLLFVERARTFDPQFAVTAQNAALIGQICRDLDGIPLALELVATRLGVMSLDAVAAHLASLPQQGKLQALLSWNQELLTTSERALLRRLSVFAGAFEVDAAEVVGAGNDVSAGDVLYLLGDLVDKSLVAFDPWLNRYRLPNTVRQFARERLVESGESERGAPLGGGAAG